MGWDGMGWEGRGGEGRGGEGRDGAGEGASRRTGSSRTLSFAFLLEHKCQSRSSKREAYIFLAQASFLTSKQVLPLLDSTMTVWQTANKRNSSRHSCKGNTAKCHNRDISNCVYGKPGKRQN